MRNAITRAVQGLGVLAAAWLLVVSIVFLAPLPAGNMMYGGEQWTAWLTFQGRAVQLAHYLEGVLQGQFGTTLSGTPVAMSLAEAAQPSLALLALSLLLSLFVGVLVVSILRLAPRGIRRGWNLLGFVGLGLPDPLIIFLVWSAVVWLLLTWHFKPLPVFWIHNVGWRHYVLPTLAISVFPTIYLGRTVDLAATEVYKEAFIQVARSKGLSEQRVLFGHAWRHILQRVCTVLPTTVTWMVSTLVLVEYLFLVPGLGRVIANMLANAGMDPPLMAGVLTVLLGAVGLVQVSTGLLIPLLDPRQRQERGEVL